MTNRLSAAAASVAALLFYASVSATVLRDIPQATGVGTSDYSYIEVGTSDYDTLLQRSSDSSQLRGLSVDALEIYASRLPSRSNWNTAVVAIADDKASSGGTIQTYYMHPEDIERLCGSFCFEFRGCNSVGYPHPQVQWYLDKVGKPELLQNVTVPVMTIADLFKTHQVRSVGLLKLDTEGWDCKILGGLMAHCDASGRADCWPRMIYFESNSLTQRREVDDTVAALGSRGYKLVAQTRQDTLLERRPSH